MKNTPLTVKIVMAKNEIIATVNLVSRKFGIPPFLMEGILSDVYRQAMEQSKSELVTDITRAQSEEAAGAAAEEEA